MLMLAVCLLLYSVHFPSQEQAPEFLQSFYFAESVLKQI